MSVVTIFLVLRQGLHPQRHRDTDAYREEDEVAHEMDRDEPAGTKT